MKSVSIPSPDFVPMLDNKPRWQDPDYRRHGWHNTHTMVRWSLSFRAPRIMPLRSEIDWTIGDDPEVARFLAMPHFSAFAVARGDRIIFETYAPDFGPEKPHALASTTKMLVNLMLGRAVAEGFVDLNERVRTYLPEIGSGYADATVKDVADMNVENSYTEDMDDPNASLFDFDATNGWRLPAEGVKEQTTRSFLRGITSDDLSNSTGQVIYKSTNSEVLGWIIERTSGKALREWLIEIVEAAGLEGCFHMTCDREGVPLVAGGACLTARDLARVGLLFARGGEGIDGLCVGDPEFMEATRRDLSAPYWSGEKDFMRYSRHVSTDGTFVGHSGWGGQFMLANPETDTAVVYFSVLQNRSGSDSAFSAALTRMMASVAAK